MVQTLACGICRTDLHLVEGDLAPRRPLVVPGHQVVGSVVSTSPGVGRVAPGDLVGAGWLRGTCGTCAWCRSGRENLCPGAEFTGWDHDGGFAEYTVVPAAFAHIVPAGFSPERAAPLLCAGIIGYRALKRSNLPPGGVLGLWGFGSSAHLTAQIASAQGADFVVSTRGARSRELAGELGASWVGRGSDRPPMLVDAAIVFAPAGALLPLALASTKRGGTVVMAGIHLSDLPAMGYEPHLFYERDLRSVTANTRADAAELLRLAGRLDLRIHTPAYVFERVDEALRELASSRVGGSLVMVGNP